MPSLRDAPAPGDDVSGRLNRKRRFRAIVPSRYLTTPESNHARVALDECVRLHAALSDNAIPGTTRTNR